MKPNPSRALLRLALVSLLLVICGCGDNAKLADVPDYSTMSDVGEFDNRTPTDSNAVARPVRPTARRQGSSDSSFGWMYYLIPAIAGSFLLTVVILNFRKGKALVDNDGLDSITENIDPDSESDSGFDMATFAELDRESLPAETAALLDSDSDFDVEDIDHQSTMESDIVGVESLAEENESEPRSVAQTEQLQNTIKKYDVAKERNEQLKTKLREKLATIEILEKEIVHLREKVTSTKEKNKKLKSKLRQKVEVIDELNARLQQESHNSESNSVSPKNPNSE